MKKLDIKKDYENLYKVSSKKIEFITVPKLKYLMVDGQGDPNNSIQFQNAITALYSVAYTHKFMFKKGTQQIDYGVMPLEGLWWADDMSNFSSTDKTNWKWTLMILQPDFVTEANFEEAKAMVAKKKDVSMIEDLRLEQMEEGMCAHILYIGPYSDETQTILNLHNFINKAGYKLAGKHREIYLNDMRRTAPEKLKTIIRQGVRER